MQKYKEINGNDYVKNSRTTINETMQSIQSMNSGTAFPTTNLFEGMKCYRTDLKKTYTLTDVENNTWVEDAHATLSDTATKLQTARALSLTGKAAGSTTFDGSANASINVTSVNADTASKLSTARRINITGNASGAATFDGSGDININTTVNESKHAAAADKATTATKVNATAPNGSAADLVFGTMAVNDYARIRVGGSDDNGWLEIATADGSNEPIYVRQYGGPYDWPNGRPGTVANEAILLDNNGNTKFPHNVTAANFVGHLAGNADSATKIVNNGDRNNLANGTKAPSGLSVYQCYMHAGYPQQYGNVISIGGTGDNELFLGWQADARLLYRSKVDTQNNWTNWRAIAFTDEINNYAPTKTGGGASGTWGINISGNAATASNVSGKIYYSADSPSVATDKLFTVKQAHAGEDNVPNNGLVIQSGPTGANYNGKLYITDNGKDGVWIGGVAEGKEVGWKRLVENWGSWNINAATASNADNATKWNGLIDDHTTENNTATWIPVYVDGKMQHTDRTKMTVGNADKLDGYHASDIINRISAANTGGIVAASLTENGYVKFANGLILQWGITDDNGKATFPIVFTKPMQVVTNIASGNEDSHNNFDDDIDDSLTTTGFKCRYFKHRYICIGI